MRNYKINIKKTIFQKSWVAERCKTKKTSRKPKKKIQRSWKWKRLGKVIKYHGKVIKPWLGGGTIYIYIPVVPHKAVAEVSKIGNL